MASKYARFLDSLERRAPEDQRFQDKVDEKKNDISDRSPDALARRWRKVRGQIDDLEEQKKLLNVELTATFQLLASAYEAAGVTKLDFAEGGGVGIQPEVYVSFTIPNMMEKLLAESIDGAPRYTIKEAKELARAAALAELRKWAVENGHENDLTINASTASAIFKEMLVNGEALPEWVKLTTDWTGRLYSK